MPLSPEFPGQGINLPISISWGEYSHSCQALVDSGAAGNFIDINLAHRLNVPLDTLDSPLSATALDGRALGDGKITQATSRLLLKYDAQQEEITSYRYLRRPQAPQQHTHQSSQYHQHLPKNV